jgi:hypothetical protein
MFRLSPPEIRGPGSDDGVWNVYFGPLKLGRFLERYRRIENSYRRLLQPMSVTYLPRLFCYLSPRLLRLTCLASRTSQWVSSKPNCALICSIAG